MSDFLHLHPLHCIPGEPLRFSIDEGDVANEFLRHGPVAAHLLLSSGAAARLIVAFPAGNSALGLWFAPGARAARWDRVGAMRPVEARDSGGRVLYGFQVSLVIDAALVVERAVLSSARVLRDYQTQGELPPAVECAVHQSGQRLLWARDRIDGAPGYALALEIESGMLDTDAHGVTRLLPAADGKLRLRLSALCGETPLTPMPLESLLREPARGDARARHSLAFLSYQEKFLAGSWRFNTYFGRDTLMSLALLMPALTAAAAEAALGAVLERLGPDGDVAHEEDIGECALLHPHAAQYAPEQPICDYKMVDDDFMLAPVVASYIAAFGAARAVTFLARRDAGGVRFAELILRNLALVVRRAAPFAGAPAASTLISLRPGQITGEWRDSADGLGGGRYAYNVNAVLVPAALRAIDSLAAQGLLGTHAGLAQAGTMAAAWEAHAPPLFDVAVDAQRARAAVARHAAELGIDPAPALASLDDAPLRFAALALDAGGHPIAVLHSDFGFALLLQHPPAAMIERELQAMMRPFPAGLMTGVGLLVANGACADAAVRPMFGPDRYHGAVVWSWQQAMLAAGLARQRQRGDLPAATLRMMAGCERQLWHAIARTRAQGNSELWSWRWEDGQYAMQGFGPQCATADESNAAQLWSTVYLALSPPPDAV